MLGDGIEGCFQLFPLVTFTIIARQRGQIIQDTGGSVGQLVVGISRLHLSWNLLAREEVMVDIIQLQQALLFHIEHRVMGAKYLVQTEAIVVDIPVLDVDGPVGGEGHPIDTDASTGVVGHGGDPLDRIDGAEQVGDVGSSLSARRIII